MTFIQPDDFASFQRLLGCDEVPEKYLRIYSTALTLFHKDGNSGPLGSLGIIAVLLAGGYQPTPTTEPEPDTDWDSVKRGQRVEARFAGNWLAGEFLGYGEHRVLLVKLDEDPLVKECRRHMVRLANGQAPEPIEALEPIAEAEPQEVGDVLPPRPWNAPSDWSQVEVGEEVWATIHGEPEDATFVRVANDGEVVVLFNGAEHTLASDLVIRAGVPA